MLCSDPEKEVRMADAGLFIGWGEVVRGREAEAVAAFGETLAYWARLEEEGVIESCEPVFLEAHGGDLEGFFLVRGDAEKLAALRIDEEFQRVIMRASLIVDRIGVVGASMGARLERLMEAYTEQIAVFA
jgi:hypothetical protein